MKKRFKFIFWIKKENLNINIREKKKSILQNICKISIIKGEDEEESIKCKCWLFNFAEAGLHQVVLTIACIEIHIIYGIHTNDKENRRRMPYSPSSISTKHQTNNDDYGLFFFNFKISIFLHALSYGFLRCPFYGCV